MRMWSFPKLLGLAALTGGVLLAPLSATAETDGRDASAVRPAEQTVERLRAELARVNAEVAALKRGDRSIRNDYRLRERMADAEALAQKLTAAEANLRVQAGAKGPAPGGAPVVASPQVSPQDGSIELEAKADLLVDQARKLDGEAGVLGKAADQIRSRKALRRKAGSWERDPFAGLETSKRNVAAAAQTQKQIAGTTTGDSSTRGTLSNPSSASPTVPVEVVSGGAPATFAPVTTGSTESAGKSAVSATASDAKSSPLPQAGFADRQALEQRLYLDPTTAAELRHALGAGGGALDPDALERGAAALRARARVLDAQARALRAKSRAP
jgi:hypothetical protein